MTADQTQGRGPYIGTARLGNGAFRTAGQSAGDMLRGVGEWMRRALIAFAVILAAGILAVVTAVFGLVLAAIAILVRFAARGHDSDPSRHSSTGGTITLEAKRTPKGWKVE